MVEWLIMQYLCAASVKASSQNFDSTLAKLSAAQVALGNAEIDYFRSTVWTVVGTLFIFLVFEVACGRMKHSCKVKSLLFSTPDM